MTEFSSALSMKLRTGHMTLGHRAQAMAGFTRLVDENLTVLHVTRGHFALSARLVGRHALGLRAGDALHLAMCADGDATCCTLDRGLDAAARAIGIESPLI